MPVLISFLSWFEYIQHKFKDNIYDQWSEAGIILGKNNLNLCTWASKFLVATQFFQVSDRFSMIFIKIFEIPWYFQVFQMYSHFFRSSGNPDGHNVKSWHKRRRKG